MSLNVNIENQRETFLQIGSYVRLTISFLDTNHMKIVSDVTTLCISQFQAPTSLQGRPREIL